VVEGSSHTVSDEHLVVHALDGSEAHFQVLVDRYTSQIFRLAYGITGDRHDAEDVVQETFLRAFQHLGRFSPHKASFKTWLFTIARNQSINVIAVLKRKAVRLFSEAEHEAEDGPQPSGPFAAQQDDPGTLLLRREAMESLRRGLERLPERQRTALLLKTQENLSYEEIAAVMETSASSVESLIFRARQRLIALMDR
jgi:RNA polymerase sigma factor (sigma-70 family)